MDAYVVLVSLKALKGGNQAGGHAVYAFYDKFGRFKIMDRSGIYNNLDDLVKKYPVDEFIPRSAATLTNVYAKFVGPQGVSVLAMEVLGVAADKK